MMTKVQCVLTGLILAMPAQAGFVEGMPGRDQMENFRDNFGGTYVDFTASEFPNRFLDSELSALGVAFATVENSAGGPLGPHNVYISNSPDPRLRDSIVGTPFANGGSDDGRYAYQIEFTSAVRYAAVERNWNSSAWTEFYDANGNLLIRASQEDFTSFYGWIADSEDMNTWISRVKMGGDAPDGSRQVGYTDDLFFGTVIPEPASLFYILSGAGTIGFLRHRRRQKNRRCDD